MSGGGSCSSGLSIESSISSSSLSGIRKSAIFLVLISSSETSPVAINAAINSREKIAKKVPPAAMRPYF